MAGSFGYEKEKYEISQKIGEQAALPKVREAGYDALVIADGFSCRTQIEQGTGRQVLHLAEVAQRALRQQGKIPVPTTRELPKRSLKPLVATLVVAGVVVGVGAASLRRNRA